MPSLPVRGAWIEINYWDSTRKKVASRSPCGERGLKSRMPLPIALLTMSLPVRGAWIEISSTFADLLGSAVAPRAGSVD